MHVMVDLNTEQRMWRRWLPRSYLNFIFSCCYTIYGFKRNEKIISHFACTFLLFFKIRINAKFRARVCGKVWKSESLHVYVKSESLKVCMYMWSLKVWKSESLHVYVKSESRKQIGFVGNPIVVTKRLKLSLEWILLQVWWN